MPLCPQLTYNLVGVPGKPEQRCKWDTLEPHQVARQKGGRGPIRSVN